MKKVTIIGSGNVGTAAAFYLAEKHVADILLIDKVEGRAEGSALDLAEASPLRGYEFWIRGTSDFEQMKDSAVVVITAGAVRKPNTLRLELLEENQRILDSIIPAIQKHAPKAIMIIVTEPVCTLTYYTWKKSGFAREKVLGVGGKLDTTRLCEFVARELEVSPVEVSAIVLGGHNEYMVIPHEYIRIGGIPVGDLLPKQTIENIISKTRDAGSTILSLLKKQTSMYSPAASIAETVEAIINDSNAIMCVPTILDGEYGYKNTCLGVPVQLGERGIKKIIELNLPLEVKEKLDLSEEIVKKAIDSLGI
jgi:malate dehydrogenase